MRRRATPEFGTFGARRSTAVHARDWWFMLVDDVELEGTPTPSHSFAQYVREQVTFLPPVLAPLLDSGRDAAWVRARIEHALGFIFAPAGERVESALVDVGVVGMHVVDRDREVAYPFVCRDVDGRTALWFSNLGPDLETCNVIARAFWSRFFYVETESTSDYRVLVRPGGVNDLVEYTCRRGELRSRIVPRDDQ